VNVGVGSCVLATLFVLWPIIMRSLRPVERRETPAVA
jgi:hypothetical protein